MDGNKNCGAILAKCVRQAAFFYVRKVILNYGFNDKKGITFYNVYMTKKPGLFIASAGWQITPIFPYLFHAV